MRGGRSGQVRSCQAMSLNYILQYCYSLLQDVIISVESGYKLLWWNLQADKKIINTLIHWKLVPSSQDCREQQDLPSNRKHRTAVKQNQQNFTSHTTKRDQINPSQLCEPLQRRYSQQSLTGQIVRHHLVVLGAGHQEWGAYSLHQHNVLLALRRGSHRPNAA